MTNAQRQARYRKRLIERAAKAEERAELAEAELRQLKENLVVTNGKPPRWRRRLPLHLRRDAR